MRKEIERYLTLEGVLGDMSQGSMEKKFDKPYESHSVDGGDAVAKAFESNARGDVESSVRIVNDRIECRRHADQDVRALRRI